MKLFALPDGTVDRKDRAQWLTMPFDLAFGEPVEPEPEPEPEAPESSDSLGPDFIIAKRRIGWRHGRMYPLRSYDNEQ